MARLSQAIVKSMLPFIINRILSCSNEKNVIDESGLASLNEDIKTLLTLLHGVHEEQSKEIKHNMPFFSSNRYVDRIHGIEHSSTYIDLFIE